MYRTGHPWLRHLVARRHVVQTRENPPRCSRTASAAAAGGERLLGSSGPRRAAPSRWVWDWRLGSGFAVSRGFRMRSRPCSHPTTPASSAGRGARAHLPERHPRTASALPLRPGGPIRFLCHQGRPIRVNEVEGTGRSANRRTKSAARLGAKPSKQACAGGARVEGSAWPWPPPWPRRPPTRASCARHVDGLPLSVPVLVAWRRAASYPRSIASRHPPPGSHRLRYVA